MVCVAMGAHQRARLEGTGDGVTGRQRVCVCVCEREKDKEKGGRRRERLARVAGEREPQQQVGPGRQGSLEAAGL